MKVGIEYIPSQGIRARARDLGVREVELLGVYDHPEHRGQADWRVHLYRVGDLLVADTNGLPIWEDHDEWADLCREYGLPE